MKFEEFSDMGFNSQQINQIMLLNPYIETNNLLKFVTPATDVNLLRKLNIACKNEKVFNDHDAMARILELLKHNVDFSALIDENLNYTQGIGIYKLLKENLEQYIPIFKRNDVTDKIIINTIKDIDRHIDVSFYLKEKFTSPQIENAQEAFKLGYIEIIDFLDKFPDNISLKSINSCIESGVDPVALYKLNPNLFEMVAAYIKDGLDVSIVNFVKEETKKEEIQLVVNLLQSNLEINEISNFLKHYPLHEYVNPNCFKEYIYLYKMNVNIENLYENNIEKNVLCISEIIDHLNDEQIQIAKQMKDFELKLISHAIKYNRKDLIPVLLNVKMPDKHAYLCIEHLLKFDAHNNTKHKIINLLYDKGSDVFNDYKSEFEFSGKQKHTLALFVYANHKDDSDIELIRDNHIGADVMEYLCYMLEEGFNINSILKDASRLDIEDIKAIKRCMTLGYDVSKKEYEK